MTTALDPRRERLLRARLYLVCPARPGGRNAGPLVRAALGGGVDVVQLREKDATDEELRGAAAELRAACDEHGALLILNDRPDLAWACGADGVHIGQEDMPVDEARDSWATTSCSGSRHTRRPRSRARTASTTWGRAVHATPTKPGRPAVGLELVAYAVEHAQVPFFAIGGIDTGNVATVVAAGAPRIAVVRAIVEAEDPGAAARELRAAVEEGMRVGAT